MEQKKTPFILSNATCPMCLFQFQSLKFKTGAYGILEKETDQHPKLYKWSDKEFENINPLYYLMWRCSNCGYIDFIESFEKKVDAKTLALRKIYKPNEVFNLPFIKEITKYTNFDNPSFETAVNTLLISAYINELPTKHEEKNYFKLARIYLRLAWLYREKYGTLTSEKESIKLKQIFKNIDEIENLIFKLEENVNKLLLSIKNRLSEIYGKDIPINNPYYVNISNFLSNIKSLPQTFANVKIIASKDSQNKLIESTPQTTQTYYDYSSYEDFLVSLMNYWPNIPLNEKLALNLSVKNYTLSYTYEDIFDTPEKRLNAIELIEDLYVRLDDYDSALNYITEIYRSGTKERQALYLKMNSKKADGTYPSVSEKALIEAQIARINAILTKASDKKKELEEKRLNAAILKIKNIISQTPNITIDELINKINELNISEAVILELKEKNILLNLLNNNEKLNTNNDLNEKIT